ncbi:MAG TPA: peptide deformylase [Blastocatellia bacterium]|nr:peptide deformylase [Blastocatellia bacterium]
MPVREILLLGNPELWRPSSPVISVNSRGTRELIGDLAETLYNFREQNGFGRGIAAPQVGVGNRLIFLNVGESFPLINPTITRASREMMELWDDCFSIPNLMIRVRRHVEVDVSYTDEHGAQRVMKASGALSELLQHEIDHLDGTLATDRAIDGRSFAMRNVVR